jgi:hypothetical protein
MRLRRIILPLLFCTSLCRAFSVDSLFEPLMRPFDLLPEYYLRFDMSMFALQRDAFFKRQYLAEPHPDLEFCFLSYKNLIASVWQVDFLFNLGQVPGDNVFTVLGVAFGINPTIELRLPHLTTAVGMAHRCFHDIDRTEYPVAYYNKVFCNFASPNYRLNTFYQSVTGPSELTFANRFGWQVSTGHYLRNFFGLVGESKLNGRHPDLWDISSTARYAFYKRTSWVFAARGETVAGVFKREDGFHVPNHGQWYWKQGLGLEAFFTRGSRGGCLFATYHLDQLPIADTSPAFGLGHSRFSKNGLLQVGVSFFN